MNDVFSPTESHVPAARKDAATYMGLFPDGSIRCAPGALQANTSHTAYLVYLKELIEALETRADVAEPVTLRQRRPDLLQLKLDEKSVRKALPTLRLVLGLLESRASEGLANNQTLQQAVASVVHQGSVPFQHAWESVKATLALKQLPLWDVLRSGDIDHPSFIFDNLTRPTQRAATTLSSGFAPELRARLLDTGTVGSPLNGLTTTQAVSKALGLTRKALRRLLAVSAIGKGNSSVARSQHVSAADFEAGSSELYGAEYINNGEAPLYLTQPDLADSTVQITGVTDDHLARLQRILHIQRALDLKPAEADAVVMAAIWAEDQGEDPTITTNTLRALGLFRHLQQHYAVSAHQYAAFICEIPLYGADGEKPFYDQLFAPENTEDGPAAAVLRLDGGEFDPKATSGADALTIKQLCLALKVDEPVLRAVLEWVVEAQGLALPTRSIEVVSACYRLTALPRLFGMRPNAGMLALALLAQEYPAYKDQLAGVPSLGTEAAEADIVDVIVGMMEATHWMQQQTWGVDQLYRSLQSEYAVLRKGCQSICEGQPLDPAGDESALHTVLQQALQLENVELVRPLLQWAGLDTEAFRANVCAIQRKHADEHLPPLDCFTEADIEDWALLDQYSMFVKLLDLGAATLEQLLDKPEWFDLLDETGTVLREPDLTTAYLLTRYKTLLARLPQNRNESDVTRYLADTWADGPMPEGRVAGAWAALETLLGEPQGSLARLTSLTPPTTLGEIDRLLRLLDLSQQQGLSVDALVELGTLPSASNHAPFQQAATALRQSCTAKQRKVLDEQLSVAWRDALVNWMLASWVPADSQRSWITKPQALADYLLIDLQVSHEPRTTRVASAIASLQRYLHQVHSRQENGYRSTLFDEAERDEWENYASRYENWKLRQQVRNEPQNFIDPTRRTRKTTAFTELENLLAQGKCQPQDIQNAMVSYLSSFEKLSNIQPISAYADGTSPLTDTYHFIGKTNVEPVEYYWRTLDMSQRDQDNAPSMLAWGEWQKISLAISGELATTALPHIEGSHNEDTRERIELIRPVIIAGRRYAVWVEWGTTALAMGKDNKPSAYYPLKVCFAFQQTDGAWSPANPLLQLDGTGPGTAFDLKQAPPEQERGSATGYPSLKTKAFEPGLCVMVNTMGIRQHDPWLTVMLLDAHPEHFAQGAAKVDWRPDHDYFLVAKDLLLLEPKHLDAQRLGPRPIEEALVKDWVRFFRDPRTVQHPYVGAVFALEESDEGREEFSWTSRAEELFQTRYEVTSKGHVSIEETLKNDHTEQLISLKSDSTWKTKADQYKFTKGKFEATYDNEQITIEISEIFTFYETTRFEIEIAQFNIDCRSTAKTASEKKKRATDIFLNSNAPVPLSAQKFIMLSISHNSKKTLEFTLYRSTPRCLVDGEFYIIEEPSTPNQSTEFLVTTKLNKKTDHGATYFEDKIILSETFKRQKLETAKTPTIKSLLTTSIAPDIKPNWALPQHEQSLLNDVNLSALKDFANNVKTGDAFQTFSRALLKVRYTTQNDYNRKMGLAEKAGTDTRLSVADAIDRARTNNNADVMNAYINEEAAAVLKEIGSQPDSVSLEAAVRLRHQHPEACRRILLYLAPSHQLVQEDELVADGHGQVDYQVPISTEITQFTHKFELHDGADLLGSLTQGYILKNLADDAVPSVEILRNSEQALYLDLKEANQKAPMGQALPVQSLRLNTLFGKQLVALATQSVEAALSWQAQCLPEPRLEAGSTASTVDFRGANGLYFWELFFHAPLLVAWQLRQNREYREVWRWCTRHLLDPYRTWTSSAGNHPPLYWLSQPIIAPAAYDAGETVNDPDLLAYAAPQRYRKALHLFVADTWQRQGDDLYRQLTRDTLVEAAICYDKALRLIGVLPEQFSTAPTKAPALATARSADFVAPLNNKLTELRDLLRNRLFNLRHGLTLDGKPATVLLEPGAYNQVALGYGGPSLELGGGIKVARPVPPCRYSEVRKSADAAVLQLIELGQTQLRFYESEASHKLALLSKRHIITLLDFPRRLQEQALESAKRGRDTLLASKRLVEQRLGYYEGLVEVGITPLEEAAIGIGYWSQSNYAMSIPFQAAAGFVDAIPTIYGMAFGGAKPASSMQALAFGTETLGKILETTSNELHRQASYQLRGQEWQFEADQARLELRVIDQQLLEQDIHIRAANIAVEEARVKLATHRAEFELMTTVFASQPTYSWLIGRMADIYSTAYDATLSLCLMAEACLQYELGDFRSTWIRTDGWLDNWRGMLAGEALERDLMQMDVAAITNNERPLDIRLDLSLCACKGWTTEQLRAHLAAGEVLFDLTARHFDEQYPGHYLRRIERIVLTFKSIEKGIEKSLSGNVAAMLTQTRNIVLLSNDSAGAQRLYSTTEGSEDSLLRDLRPNQQAAIWSAKEVIRIYDLQPSPKDETRYQPFEGTGAISSWVLSFPNRGQAQAPLYKDGKCVVTDIEIQISYSAMDGGEAFSKKVKTLLANADKPEGTEAEKAEAAKKAEAQRKAEAAAAAEVKRKAEAAAAAEKKRLADAAAAAEVKRIADAAEAAEVKRKAEAAKEAAETKRKAEAAKKAAEAKRKADAAKKAAETKRKATATAAVAAAKQAELSAKDSLKAAEADAKAAALKTSGAAAEAKRASAALSQAREACEQATTARKNAEAAATASNVEEAVAESEKAKLAAENAKTAAKAVADARKAAERTKPQKELLATAKALLGCYVQVDRKNGQSPVVGRLKSYNAYNITVATRERPTRDWESTVYFPDIADIQKIAKP